MPEQIDILTSAPAAGVSVVDVERTFTTKEGPRTVLRRSFAVDEDVELRDGRDDRAEEEVDTFETFVRCTAGVSLSGLPAISLPVGVGKGGLPIAMETTALA